MTSWYYVHCKYRKIGKSWKDATILVKYNDKIILDLFEDFKNICGEILKKDLTDVVDYDIFSWNKFDKEK